MKKVAIMTGAGSGIGEASALALLAEGYHVSLAGQRKDQLEPDTNVQLMTIIATKMPSVGRG